MRKKRDYAWQRSGATSAIEAPPLLYQPVDPKRYRPKIGLIGAAGLPNITCAAYRRREYDVPRCVIAPKPRRRRARENSIPSRDVHDPPHIRVILLRLATGIEVVGRRDASRRAAILKTCSAAGKHILSQKPFLTDWTWANVWSNLRRKKGGEIAVKPEWRWAPHCSSYMPRRSARSSWATYIGSRTL